MKKLLLCVFLLVITIVLKAQVSPFSFGNGSVDSPYQIQTAQQLDAVRNYPDKHFILMNDLRLDTTDYKEWRPIVSFSGTFNGNGYTIKCLTIKSALTNYTALFETLNTATIKKLSFSEVNITGRQDGKSEVRTAALCAYALNSSVEECHILSGSITGGYTERGSSTTGGIIAFARDNRGNSIVTLNNCSNNSTITGGKSKFPYFASTGGIIGSVSAEGNLGDIDNGTITVNNCNNNGFIIDVEGYNGGIIGETMILINSTWETERSGRVLPSSGTGVIFLNNCINNCTFIIKEGTNYCVGGIVGSDEDMPFRNNCISTCTITEDKKMLKE